MLRSGLSRLIAVAAFLAAVAIFAGAIWFYAYGAALDGLERRARSDLALAADSLKAELEQFRALAVLTADHPAILPALARGAARIELREVLQEVADKAGALDIVLLDAKGMQVSASSGIIAQDIAQRPDFARALHGALGVAHENSMDYGRRTFRFAAPVFSPEGPVLAVLIVVADIEALEASWRGDRPAVFFTDRENRVFISNRSELVGRSRNGEGTTAFVNHTAVMTQGHEIWQVDGGPYLPALALHQTLDLPVIEMVGEILISVAPARSLAGLQAVVAATLCLTFGAMLFLATERRRALAEANVALEGRVAARTAELQKLNADLQREVTERVAAEAGLKKAQADLVQAGKLAALGQMSAGISHELNQPLMAIRSFAENAQGFLDRGEAAVVARNLGRISEMARRMGRIIQNLRAFARQESEPIRDVDIVSVIDAAVETMQAKAILSQATIDWVPPDPVLVRGGEVRLQQVIVNLLSNAIDAMEGCETKTARVALNVTPAKVFITVSDTGPGITEPGKIFEPFYTTKAVGGADGMGLGLSISYGLVQSFGGAIRGCNRDEGGAEFTVELDRTTGGDT